MERLQKKAMDIVLADPAVAGLGSSVGGCAFNASVNIGRLFISLKSQAERHNIAVQAVVARLRARLTNIPGMRVFMVPAQDLRVGGRQSQSQYQFTLWSSDIDQLQLWVPRVLERVQQAPGVIDVTTDREQGGLQTNVIIDRNAATRLGVRIQDIDNALNDAFSQRQISTIYSQRNQYRVVLEVSGKYQRDPTDLSQVYVPGSGSSQVPLSAVARVERWHRAVGGQPSGPVSGDDHHLQCRARHAAGGRNCGGQASRRRHAHSRYRCTPISPAT